MSAFWTLAALCVALLAALWWSLALKAGGSDAGLRRLISRLDLLLSLPDRGKTPEACCSAVLDAAVAALAAERGAVYVHDRARGALVPTALAGNGAEELKGKEIGIEEGLIGRAFTTRRLQRSGGAEALAVPLFTAGESVGVLALYGAADGRRRLAAGDERFLALLAREAALALRQLEAAEGQDEFTLEMLQVLARAAETKDQTLGDSERARALARRVAAALGLPAADVRRVEYAAMLHKVGKIGIDQALLSKPGKLTAAEYEQIKKYTTIGHEILSKSRALEPVARVVRHQQEWYNGKGYPDGLRGDDIPIGARIVAVVNAWEAMRADRPYRKALSREAAVAELKKGAGGQFDPAVVVAFLAGAEASASAPSAS